MCIFLCHIFLLGVLSPLCLLVFTFIIFSYCCLLQQDTFFFTINDVYENFKSTNEMKMFVVYYVFRVFTIITSRVLLNLFYTKINIKKNTILFILLRFQYVAFTFANTLAQPIESS